MNVSTKSEKLIRSENGGGAKKGEQICQYLSTLFLAWLLIVPLWAVILILEVLHVLKPFGQNFTFVDNFAFIGFSLLFDFFRIGLVAGIFAQIVMLVLVNGSVISSRKKLSALVFPVIIALAISLPFFARRVTFIQSFWKTSFLLALALFASAILFVLINRIWRLIKKRPVWNLIGALFLVFLLILGTTLLAHRAMDMPRVRWFVMTQSIQKPDMFSLFYSNELRLAVGASPIVSGRAKLLRALDDPDGDGFSSAWLTGGNDCNSLDPSINPLAFDVNNNGIDEDCYNGDYTAELKEREFEYSGSSLQSQPDIVVFYIDGMGWDKQGINGYPRNTTPFVDTLAREGILFDKGITHSTSSFSIMTSVFSGASVTEHRVMTNVQEASDKLVSLYELFQNRGYHTLYIDDSTLVEEHPLFSEDVVDGKSVHPFPQGVESPPYDSWLKPLLENVSDEKPIFAVLHFSGIHQPIIQLPEYMALVDSAPSYVLELETRTSLSPDKIKEIELVNYIVDGEVRRVDSSIEELASYFASRSGERGTLFMVMSDQGEQWGQTEVRWADHGVTHYEDEIRVSLIFSPASFLPGAAPGTRISSQVRLIDIFPTLVDLFALDLPDDAVQQVSGKSLLPLMAGESDDANRDALIIHNTGAFRTFNESITISIRRADDIKFVYMSLENHKELYNLSGVSYENPKTDNLYFSNPELAKELENQLMQRYQEDYHRFYKQYGGLVRDRDLTERELVALKELGYIKE